MYMFKVEGEPLCFLVQERYEKYKVTKESCEQRRYTWIEVRCWFTIIGYAHFARIKKIPSP
ncbi:MAG TPA: hypothetical protein PK295_04320 [Candidatus Magasanikbacteria bacterium]|nr:hypothetical protein [Candidatus Magasanikbacteria bacterium]